MRMHLYFGMSLLLIAVVGCGARTPALPPGLVDDKQSRLGPALDFDLAQLLKEDRESLAKKAANLQDIVNAQTTMLASKPPQTWLLPRQNTPKTVLLHRPKFSSEAGFSLPEYHKRGAVDAELALHYARHGDFEAACKLAPAQKAELSRERLDTNYPVEWTLFVATAQHLAELKMLEGKPEGATELAVIHKQLQDVLDEKAKTGPLGALLLPTGKQSLADAAVAWRQPGHIKTTLADDIDTVVQSWGEIPAPQPLLGPGASKETIEKVLGATAGERGVAATGAAVARAVDLLALPVTRDGLDGVVAFFNEKGQLGELQVVYVGKIQQRFPEPRHLVWPLVNRGGEGKAPIPKATLPRASFQGGSLVYDVMLIPRSNSLGAIVLVSDGKSAPITAKLPAQPMHFSPLMLDRSFETNRLALDRMKPVDPVRGLVIDRSEVIQGVQQPVQDPIPAEIILEREKDHDIVRALHFRWKARQNVNLDAGAKIVAPLWTAYGRATLEDQEDDKSPALVLRWEEGDALYSLRLPYSDTESLNFAVAQRDHSDAALAAREKVALGLDEKDRQQRLSVRKPVQRLDRSHYLAGLKLGQSKEDATKLLPRNPEWHRQEVGSSIILSNLAQPNPNARPQPTSWLRQLIVRFDSQDRVAEIRGLYTEGPGRSDPRNLGLLDRMILANGEPQRPAAIWNQLWADLPAVGGPAQCFRWQDDVTTLDVLRDAFTVQVCIKENPKDLTEVGLSPLSYVGVGPENCPLGASRADLLKTWPNAPTTEDGALVLAQPVESKFDALIVYLEGDKVQRVVGRVREKLTSGPGNVDSAIHRFYAENPRLGVLRRRMPESTGQLLGGWGWHDDSVRIWAFGQETPEGPRLFVEWRHWPVAPTTTASR